MADSAQVRTRPGALPSGRHSLTREQVVASQRSRMLAAMAETMMEKGYVGTPVAEIIRRAGVSRETFYQQFRSKQDCFVQGLEAALDVMLELRSHLDDPARPPLETFREALQSYLDTLASQPALARLFLVEVYAAGPEAVELRTRFQGEFAAGIAEMFRARSAEDRFACETLVAAIAQIVTQHLVAEDIDGLRALEDPLVALAGRLFR